MSKGPTLTGQTCIEATKKKYLNINFSREDWCEYKGVCKRDHLVIDREEACMLCKWRKLLDIPKILDAALEERNEHT